MDQGMFLFSTGESLMAIAMMAMRSAMEKSMLFSVRYLYISVLWVGWNKLATRFLVLLPQESDYPAFPGERQGCVKRSRKCVNILSRLIKVEWNKYQLISKDITG
ncbi:MAG TPA: hypothetical protein VF326_14455 [Anaerolineaceae bacterium]